MHDEPATPGTQGESPGRFGREGGSSSGRWRQHAGFSIFFDSVAGDADGPVWRTRLYHEETGDETTMPGGVLSDWVRWIVDRAGPVPDLSDVSGAGPGTLSVEVLSARIVAGPAIDDGVENLRVEAELRVSGLSALRWALPATVIEVVFGERPP